MCHSDSSSYSWYVIELVAVSIKAQGYLHAEYLVATFEQDCHDCTNFSIAYSPHCPCMGYCVGRSRIYTSHWLLVLWPINEYLESTWCRHTKFYQLWVQNYISVILVNRHVQHSTRPAWPMYSRHLHVVCIYDSGTDHTRKHLICRVLVP